MIPLILKRAPVGDNQDDYSVLENRVKVGPHLQGRSRRRPPLDVGERPLGGHGQASRARLRGDARGCDGGVSQRAGGGNRTAALPPLRRPLEDLSGRTHWATNPKNDEAGPWAGVL
jgi:hypothetical protein